MYLTHCPSKQCSSRTNSSDAYLGPLIPVIAVISIPEIWIKGRDIGAIVRCGLRHGCVSAAKVGLSVVRLITSGAPAVVVGSFNHGLFAAVYCTASQRMLQNLQRVAAFVLRNPLFTTLNWKRLIPNVNVSAFIKWHEWWEQTHAPYYRHSTLNKTTDSMVTGI